MREQSDVFYPNALKAEDVDGLTAWQLLIAVCHFGPIMGDCVSGNYGYYLEDETIYLKSEHGKDIDLTDDVDVAHPAKGLLRYAVVSPWTKFAAKLIREAIARKES